jgi:hypothetical protein
MTSLNTNDELRTQRYFPVTAGSLGLGP